MLDLTQRTTTQDLLDQSQEQDTHKADFKAPAREFSFDQTSRLITNPDGSLFNASVAPLSPTPWAWNQVFTKLGPTVYGSGKTKSLPADYLLALRPEQRAELLNDHLQHTKQNWFVRSFDDQCRAVLSDKYTPISNTELLHILNEIAVGTEGECSLTRSSSVTPDSLNARVIWRDISTGDDSKGNGNWGIGTYIRNGETGNRRGGILPLIQRRSCENSIIVDAENLGFEFLHLGSLTNKLVQVKAAIADALPFAAQLLDKLVKADEENIPDFVDVIAGICKQYGWDDKTKARVTLGTEGRDTRLGLINGVTFAAHEVADPDAQADIQIAGGSILLAPGSVFHRYASIGRESVTVR